MLITLKVCFKKMEYYELDKLLFSRTIAYILGINSSENKILLELINYLIFDLLSMCKFSTN